MKDLVFLDNEQILTTSLKVAEVFQKNHRHILRNIRDLIETIEHCPEVGSVALFRESSYINARNNLQPMYLMNRDGFSLLVMGFKGKKALQFKLNYIQAFNKMEAELVKLMAERQSAEWLEVRKSSKETNKALMKAVHDEIIPNARANGSTVEDKIFYMTYNRLLNAVAKIPAGARDKLPKTILLMLDQMQSIAIAKIRADARAGKKFWEIYSSTKQILEGYAQVALVAERFEAIEGYYVD